MANWNYNYINDIPPNQQYQEFGDEPNEPVPFVYAPIIYNIQCTGVYSFEYNGTTYYNYDVYEVPVMSYYIYSGYDSMEVNNDNYNANVVTEDDYDYSVNVNTDIYNFNVTTEEDHDYSVEVYAGSSNSNIVSEDDNAYSIEIPAENYNLNVVTEDGSVNKYYQQRPCHHYLVSSCLSTDSTVSTSIDRTYTDSISTSDSSLYNKSLHIARAVSDNNYPLEANLTSTEELGSYTSFSSSNECPEVNTQNNACPNTQTVDNFDDMRNEGTDIENVAEYDINTSAMKRNDNSNDCNESNVLEHLIDIRKNNLYEDSEEQSFIYEENKILDWSIEVEDNDLKEEDDDSFKIDDNFEDMRNECTNIEHVAEYDIKESGMMTNDDSNYCNESNVLEHFINIRKKDSYEDSEKKSFVYEENKILDWSIEVEDNDLKEEEDDSFKVDLSTSNDIEPYKSKEVVKYLKENLYLYALSGHMSLKESLPVVDILPTIDEEAEFVEDDYRLECLELQNNCLKNGKEIGATEIKSLCPMNDTQLKSSEEVEIRKDEIGETEIKSFFPKKDTQLKHSEEVKIRKEEIGASQIKSSCPKNDTQTKSSGEVEIKKEEIEETQIKSLCPKNNTLVKSSEEVKIIKEEIGATQTKSLYHKNDAQLKPREEVNLRIDKIGAKQIKSLCLKNDTQLKSSEELEIRTEVMLNLFDSNRMTNATCNVPQEMEPRVECYLERNVGKTIDGEEKVPSKKKKKISYSEKVVWQHVLLCK